MAEMSKEIRLPGSLIGGFRDLCAETVRRDGESRFREMIDALPAAIYTTDAHGRLTHFNQACIEFSGRTPTLGSDRWCVTWKLYYPDGRPMPHAECPMAVALKTQQTVDGAEAIAERPDGSRIWFAPYPTPLFDDAGHLVGGINMLVDITERKAAEAQRNAESAALAKLNQLSAQLWQMRSLREGLDELLVATIDLLGADFGNIQLIDPASGMLRIAVHRGFQPDFLDCFREISADDDAAYGRALRTGQRIVIEDVEADEGFASLRAVAPAAGFRAVQSTPLIGRNQILLGMISTHFRAARRPTQYELRLLDLYAQQAAGIIERHNADAERERGKEALRQAASQQRAVAQIGEYALSHSLQEVFDFATATIAQALDVEYCKVLELLPNGEYVLLRSGVGWKPGLVGTAVVDTGLSSQAGYTLASDAPVVVRDLRQEKRFSGPPLLVEHGVISGMSCIIRQPDGTAWGVLGTHAKRGIDFTPDDVNFLTAVASTLGGAIEHHRAEQALRKSEDRHRSLLSLLPAAVYSCDVSGLITYYNDRAAELWGRAPRMGDVDELFCGSEQLILPDGTPLPHEQCPMAVALREGRAFRGEEVNIRRPDGSLVTVLVNIDPIRDEDGVLVGAINAFHDVSAIKQAEHALRESEERFRMIADNMAQLAWTCDELGNATWYNRRWFEYTGLSVEEMRQRGWAACHHPDHVDRVVASITRARECGEFWEDTFPLRGQDGQYRWFLSQAYPIRNEQGAIVRWFGTNTNVDNTKRAEDRLRLLWEAAAVMLTADDPDGMLRELFRKIGPQLGVDAYFNYLVNDAGDALHLASCEGVPADTARSITHLELGQAISGMAALQRQPIIANHIQQTADPKAQLVKSLGIRAYVCNPLMIDDVLLGTLSFASRTKDQFDSEELTFFATVCCYVTVAYERLRLLGKLKETDRRKDEFLATLAHELRNPLAPVKNAVQLLRLKGPDEPELRWGRDVIDRQVSHLTRLIDDLLDISRISRDKLELRKARVALTDVVQAAVEMSRPLVEQGSHELTVTLPPDPIHLNADLVRLAQVFMNLLTNAAKYTERPGRICLIAEREQREVIIRVRDTGVGIPADKLSSVFEMFFQVDRSLERSRGGLGIGLSLVRRLVELHGGNVKAYSAGAGKGSEFTVRLPILAEAVETEQARATSDLNKADGKPARRILVVDDMQDAADSLAMLLEMSGNEVHTAYDGLAAVEATAHFRPDVALLDIGMPKLNGYEACRRIRELPSSSDIVLIALSGWGQEEDKRRTREAGFDAHLVKPVDAAALEQLLQRLPLRT